jgi:hypothetical protein
VFTRQAPQSSVARADEAADHDPGTDGCGRALDDRREDLSGAKDDKHWPTVTAPNARVVRSMEQKCKFSDAERIR